MADPSQPKKPPPEEGPTRTFRLKLDGWMDEILKEDFDLEAPVAPDPAAPPVPAVPPAGESPRKP